MFRWRSPALVVAFAALVGSPSLAQVAEPPAIAPGDSWTYRQTTDAAKEIAWTRKVVAVGADGVVDMQIGERAFRVDGSLNILDPKGPDYSRAQYRFPIQVGNEWSFVNKVPFMAVEIDQRNKYKVVAYEALTVPAGTFDCFRVEGTQDLTFKASYNRQTRETYWYCPKVGSFAKMTRESSTFSRDSASTRESTEMLLLRYQRRN
jgi:hypothetical protein